MALQAGAAPYVGTSISHVKQVNCDRKFEFRYCIVTDWKTAHASEIVFWVTFGFLLEGTHLTKFFFVVKFKLDVMHRVDVSA